MIRLAATVLVAGYVGLAGFFAGHAVGAREARAVAMASRDAGIVARINQIPNVLGDGLEGQAGVPASRPAGVDGPTGRGNPRGASRDATSSATERVTAAAATPVAAAAVTPPPDAEAVIGARLPRTRVEVFRAALALSRWPASEWARVERIARCESSLDTSVRGDGGRSVGLLQVHVPAHPEIARAYDLEDPVGNLDAGFEVQQRARAAGLPSPWAACEDGMATR